MAVDLNFPPEDDGVPDGQDMLQEPGGAGHEAAAGHGPPYLDLNTEPCESWSDDDDGNVVDGFIGPAEAACFDLNMEYYESESDDDAHVYAEDFYVSFGEGNLQGSNTTVRTRMQLTNEQRREIYEELLLRSKNGVMGRQTTTRLAAKFNVNRCYVQAIWRTSKKCRAAGVPVNINSKRKQACGRLQAQVDLSKVKTIPLLKRSTLKSLAQELGCSISTVHRLFKAGKLRRHSNTLKPCLRDDNKNERLKYCVAMLDGQTVQNEPNFIDMKNIIHIDEKWFNSTQKTKKFYMLPEEEDPLRTIQNKNSIPKCMLLCGVSPPRYDSAGVCYFDEKIGIWPFVRKELAQRSSRLRLRGTLITKSINVTRDVSRSYLVSKVIPAIVARWPHEHRRETIWIQQDNTRTHIEPDDEDFHAAVEHSGLDIRIFNQPPNSLDLNVLDLGFFASLQAMTFLTSCRNMDELILNVENKFREYDQSKLRRVFLTLQGCMTEIMKVAGENGYKVPHMYKDGLEMAGMLPSSLNVDLELYQSVLQKLAE